jgi:transcriptional antiterminator
MVMERISDSSGVVHPKMFRMLDLVKELHVRRMTVKEIADFLQCSPRTVWRYFIDLNFFGISIDKDFDNKYFIAQDNCPLCNKQTTTNGVK